MTQGKLLPSTSSPPSLHCLQLVQTSPGYFQPPLFDRKCLEFHRGPPALEDLGMEANLYNTLPSPPLHVNAHTHTPCNPKLRAECSCRAAFPTFRLLSFSSPPSLPASSTTKVPGGLQCWVCSHRERGRPEACWSPSRPAALVDRRTRRLGSHALSQPMQQSPLL